MSDKRFEQDLRSVLRSMAPDDVPSALREAAAAVPRTHVASARRPFGAVRSFAALAGVAAVTVLAVAGIAALTRGGPGPIVGAPTASPSSSLTVAPSASRSPLVTLEFAVVPPDGHQATTAEYAAVANVMAARLISLYGSGSVTTIFGDGAQQLPVALRTSGIPADDAQRAAVVLGTTGHVEFVAPGSQPLDVGAAVDPGKYSALFDEGWIAAAVASDHDGSPVVSITLKPGGARLFADWSTAHVGEFFAIVLDGQVLLAPLLNEAIPGGEMQISFAVTQADAAASARSLAAILSSGRLPFPAREISMGDANPPSEAPHESPSASVMATRAPSGDARWDACLAQTSLADFGGSQPIAFQEDVNRPAEAVAIFAGPVAGDPTMLWEMVCRTERQADGSAIVWSSAAGPVDRAFAGAAQVGHVMTPFDGMIITGRATEAAARIAVTLGDGSQEFANSATNADGTFWLVWLHNGQQAITATAYDAAGTPIWTEAIKP
jgi:hypothetical protein